MLDTYYLSWYLNVALNKKESEGIYIWLNYV